MDIRSVASRVDGVLSVDGTSCRVVLSASMTNSVRGAVVICMCRVTPHVRCRGERNKLDGARNVAVVAGVMFAARM